MLSFKDQWNLAMALDVLQSETVDSNTWVDATKWLLLYGPPEISTLISQASLHASSEHFPALKTAGFDHTGQPVYNLHDLAASLGITAEEALQHMKGLGEEKAPIVFNSMADVKKIQ